MTTGARVRIVAESINRVLESDMGDDSAARVGVLITAIAAMALDETENDPIAARLYVARAIAPSIEDMIGNLHAIREQEQKRRIW